MITLYGIPNCDTVKKARTWLEEHNIDFEFHNFKKSGISTDKITQWCNQAGIDLVLNKRGTTWRKLDSDFTATLDNTSLIQLMSEQPSLIKRPVVESKGVLLVGFKPEQFESLL